VHIGLNLIYLVPGETGGMEIYARELIPALVRERPDLRLTAFVNREAAEAREGPWHELIPHVTVPVTARRRSEWVRGEQQLLPRAAAQYGIELMHSLGSTAPAWGAFRRVVTIQDLTYRVYPEAHFGIRSLGMRMLVPLAARRSHRIIAPSRNTRDDLVRLLHVPAGKVDVVPDGVGMTAPAAPTDEAELRRRYSLDDRPSVLAVSAKRPHKNLLRLFDALALIPGERRPMLVLTGYRTSHEDALRRRATELGLDADVRILGWVTVEELEGLYLAASCFVFPSLYEGFGLPVLEAMARGVPVACSDRGSLREVAGDAALLFDPERPESIAAAIESLLHEPTEAARLRSAGIERARKFSWSAAALGTLASYERALS
jgi:glycosyltransferase involved in cell wall biosynthesis